MDRVAWLTCVILALVHGRIYERCELARELQTLGVEPRNLATWVCIAFHESRFDTTATNAYSGDHGIFQISELYWCGPGKVCGLPCSALRDSDISNDLKCALQIYEEHTRIQGDGFRAWVVYPTYCTHNTKKYLVGCDINTKHSVPIRKFKEYAYVDNYFLNVNNTDSVEKSLPRYLAIGDIFRGYSHNVYSNTNNRMDWYNSKIKNIDDLKVPTSLTYSSQPVIETYTSTTTPATTTEYIAPVMPWRKIETNQFRKKHLFRDLSHNIPPAKEQLSFTRNYVENSRINTMYQTQPTQMMVEEQKFIVSTNKMYRPLASPNPYLRGDNASQAMFSLGKSSFGTVETAPFGTIYRPIASTMKTTTKWTTSPSISTTTKWNTQRSMTTFKTTERPVINLPTAMKTARNDEGTTKPTVTRTLQTNFSTNTFISKDTSTATPLASATSTTPSSLQTTASNLELGTTFKPQQTTTHSSRRTQSIFDLYLNPTKSPKWSTFRLDSLPASKFRLNIFASGTTTIAPSRSMASRLQSGDSGGAVRNQINRQNK